MKTIPALVLVLLVSLVMAAHLALAGGLENESGKRLAQIVKGGVLYDKWYKELELATPKGTHPAYPAAAKKKGASTWRCKECHGWDYRGKDGAYKSGSHFSGIVGIRALDGQSESRVVAILKDNNHLLGGRISAEGLQALAAFVVAGQVDMTRYIDSKTKRVKGNASVGERIFAVSCARCHGADGREINFGSDKKPVYMGTVANKNPWETLHKIRMGQPAEEMTSTLFMPEQTQVDILAYAMSLPKK